MSQLLLRAPDVYVQLTQALMHLFPGGQRSSALLAMHVPVINDMHAAALLCCSNQHTAWCRLDAAASAEPVELKQVDGGAWQQQQLQQRHSARRSSMSA